VEAEVKTLLALALVLAPLAGCKVAATGGDYRWSVKAPAQVVEESRLQFAVEATAKDGTPVLGVPYVWLVDWVGVHGVKHQGHTGEAESIRVKGGSGRAILRVLAMEGAGMVEVASHSFGVLGGQPPAK